MAEHDSVLACAAAWESVEAPRAGVPDSSPPTPDPAGPPRVAGECPLPARPGFACHPRWPANMAAAWERSGGHAAGVAGSCSPALRADAFRRGPTVAIVRRALGECGAKSAPVGRCAETSRGHSSGCAASVPSPPTSGVQGRSCLPSSCCGAGRGGVVGNPGPKGKTTPSRRRA